MSLNLIHLLHGNHRDFMWAMKRWIFSIILLIILALSGEMYYQFIILIFVIRREFFFSFCDGYYTAIFLPKRTKKNAHSSSVEYSLNEITCNNFFELNLVFEWNIFATMDYNPKTWCPCNASSLIFKAKNACNSKAQYSSNKQTCNERFG